MADRTIHAEGLTKNFGKTRALDGLDLHISGGSLVALLGPNGAGKTTAVRILTTLLRPDTGQATVAGFDVVKESNRIKPLIGLAGQNVAVDEYLRAGERQAVDHLVQELRGARPAVSPAPARCRGFAPASFSNSLIWPMRATGF